MFGENEFRGWQWQLFMGKLVRRVHNSRDDGPEKWRWELRRAVVRA